MKIKRGIYTGLIIASIAFLYAGCQERSNTATETSATGRTGDESTNTENETPVKLKEYLTGDWTLDAAASGNGDNTAPQRITFTTEATYRRYTGKQQRSDSGLFRVNEQHKILYLESQQNGSPEEWQVTMNGDDQMTLALRNANEQGRSNSFSYRRNAP